jgi:hypothetical protein
LQFGHGLVVVVLVIVVVVPVLVMAVFVVVVMVVVPVLVDVSGHEFRRVLVSDLVLARLFWRNFGRVLLIAPPAEQAHEQSEEHYTANNDADQSG